MNTMKDNFDLSKCHVAMYRKVCVSTQMLFFLLLSIFSDSVIKRHSFAFQFLCFPDNSVSTLQISNAAEEISYSH